MRRCGAFCPVAFGGRGHTHGVAAPARDVLQHSAMPIPTSSEVVPRSAVNLLGPRSSVALPRQAFQSYDARDEVARRAAYRRFLTRTQDVIVSAIGYPGGLSALIRDRERVTLRLVRLLG